MFDFLSAPLGEEITCPSPLVELPEGAIDPRFTRSSYSSNLSLHACPRFYQLEKLQTARVYDQSSNVTFSYGHAVGEGVQQYLIHRDLNKAILAAFMFWDVDYLDENAAQKKSFPAVVAALMQLDNLCMFGFDNCTVDLNDYEVAVFNGKPAAELSFRIHFPHTTYRGFVDLVLKNKFTNELKTSSATWVNHYNYKNSAQAIGYSVILDKLAPGTAAYSVLYLVQMTKLEKYEVFDFPKTYHQRALWLKDRLWDEQIIVGLANQYGNYNIWPTHGESCTRFGRTCQFMDVCHLQTEGIMTPLREEHMQELDRDTKELKVYDFEFTLEELLS
jgi:hypothetical protein